MRKSPPSVRTFAAVQALALPWRKMAGRFGFVLLCITALALLVLSKSHSTFTERLRFSVMDMLIPVTDVMTHPVDAVMEAGETLRALFALQEENRRLLAENARLKQWYDAALRLQRENQSMRIALHAVPTAAPHFVSARVIGDVSGAYERSVLINAGEAAGVMKGHAVTAAEGLVGRVVDVSGRGARVLLLTDINARVPVLVDGALEHSILAGDNTPYPLLKYLPGDTKVTEGLRVVTSGEGGVFPPDVAVGQVVRDAEGVLRVQPFADWSRLHYVSVLDYRLPMP